jgi:hypothetical protein
MKPEVPVDREQGKVQEDEQIQANAPAPIEPTPTQADEAMLEGVVQNAGVEQPAQQAPAGQPAYTVRNPNLLLPASVNYGNFNNRGAKTPVETAYDAGTLFQVLGRTNPTFKLVSEELLGAKRGSNPRH